LSESSFGLEDAGTREGSLEALEGLAVGSVFAVFLLSALVARVR
jgi:tetrahydromethanopterin S-methyltransferase subunit F